MTTDDICVLCFTSALNLHERALSVHRTWLNDFNYGFLVGGSYTDSDLKMVSAGETIGEDYQSCADKQYYGLKKLYEMFPEKKWYFITGCDAFIYAQNLTKLLDTFDSTQDLYIGGGDLLHYHLENLNLNVEYISGGAGFALSNSITKKLVQKLDELYDNEKSSFTIKDWSFCDVTIAYLLKKYWKVLPTMCDGFSSFPPYHLYTHKFECPPIAYHYLSIREMYRLYTNRPVKRKNFFQKVFDKLSLILSRKLHTKHLVNDICCIMYGVKH